MKLHLNLQGITFDLSIQDYIPSKFCTPYDVWCTTRFSILCPPWLSYKGNHLSTFLPAEIERLADLLRKHLDGTLAETVVMDCIEPDFQFIFYPLNSEDDYFDGDGTMEWRVRFWDVTDHSALSDNFISLRFYDDNMNALYQYLRFVMREISADAPEIQQLKDNGHLVP